MEENRSLRGRHQPDRPGATGDQNQNAPQNPSPSDSGDEDELDRPEGGTGEHRNMSRARINRQQDFAMSREEYSFDDEEQYQPAPMLDEDLSADQSHDNDQSMDDDDFIERVDLSEAADYYSILALPRTPAPTAAQIRTAYHSLSLLFHPDKQPPHRRAIADQHFNRIQRAYETLLDPRKRVVYDMLGEEGVRAEYGSGGAMGRSGEADTMRLGVKAMSPEEFRQWFLAVMKRRERAVLEKLVGSGVSISLSFLAWTLCANSNLLNHPKALRSRELWCV